MDKVARCTPSTVSRIGAPSCARGVLALVVCAAALSANTGLARSVTAVGEGGVSTVLPPIAQTPTDDSRRPINLEDHHAIRSVSGLELSPDGQVAVYVVREIDGPMDRQRSTLWRVAVDDGQPERLTHGSWDVASPRFSPDGRYVSFTSSRDAEAWGMAEELGNRGQVYVLPVGGGEMFPVTALETGVTEYEWSPNGNSLAVVGQDIEPQLPPTPFDTTPPIVVTRLKHKYDGDGYLDDRRTHVYTVPLQSALESRGLQHDGGRQLTDGPYDDRQIDWSPDGERIAFQSNRTVDPDRNLNSDLWIVDAESGAIDQLTTDGGGDGAPRWSPDGRSVAYIHRQADSSEYAMSTVRVIDVVGGAPRDLTARLDRRVSSHRWAPEGDAVDLLLTDRGRRPLVRMTLDGQRIDLLAGVVNDFRVTDDRIVAIRTTPTRPAEVYAIDRDAGGALAHSARDLSAINSELFERLSFGAAEDIHFESQDGTPIHGFVIHPPGFDAADRYPLILWIHGGPVGQFTEAFNFTPQYLASLGYVVLLINPRGSSGYGEEFSRALFADWGNLDYQDVMAGVDHLVARGYVDDQRLGVGGYSYGGILTNYVIYKTDRFKAAISAASDADYYSAFGNDDWYLYWAAEFGYPWENVDLYRRVSPITYVAQVKTPTLFLHGQLDARDPEAQSEQMYVSLKLLGVETALIIYPGAEPWLSPALLPSRPLASLWIVV